MYPQSIKDLIESFKLLPGIGRKTAERLAFSVLDLEDEQIDFFSDSISNIKTNVRRCRICNCITDKDVCDICHDNNRNFDMLCVVDDSKNVFLFEKLAIYRGTYHVLDGLISPLDGINPEDIGIHKLIERIKSGNYEEIIFAFKPSIEGETTALYIKRILSGIDIRVSKLASGIPIGADMEYLDGLTLEQALNGRKIIE